MGLLPVRIDPPTLISFYLRQGYGGQVGGQVYVPYLFYCLAPALAAIAAKASTFVSRTGNTADETVDKQGLCAVSAAVAAIILRLSYECRRVKKSSVEISARI